MVCKEAAKGVEFFHCFWLRGMMPAVFTEVPDEYGPKLVAHLEYVNVQNEPWESGTYYGDASGGKGMLFLVRQNHAFDCE